MYGSQCLDRAVPDLDNEWTMSLHSRRNFGFDPGEVQISGRFRFRLSRFAPSNGPRGEDSGFVIAHVCVVRSRYWEGETVNAKTDHIATFAVARALILNDTQRSAVDRLGLGMHPFWQLERLPVDMVNWPAFNSHRLDVTLNSDFVRCCDQKVVQHVLGADEAFFGCDFITEASSANVDSCHGPSGNSSLESCAGGSAGKRVLSPAPFLLAHWMARHFGLLQ
jgi:hypothetical protein